MTPGVRRIREVQDALITCQSQLPVAGPRWHVFRRTHSPGVPEIGGRCRPRCRRRRCCAPALHRTRGRSRPRPSPHHRRHEPRCRVCGRPLPHNRHPTPWSETRAASTMPARGGCGPLSTHRLVASAEAVSWAGDVRQRGPRACAMKARVEPPARMLAHRQVAPRANDRLRYEG